MSAYRLNAWAPALFAGTAALSNPKKELRGVFSGDSVCPGGLPGPQQLGACEEPAGVPSRKSYCSCRVSNQIVILVLPS